MEQLPNGIKEVDKEILFKLLDHNTQKMHHHGEVSFKLQNWALLITLGCLSFVWKEYPNKGNWHIQILLHLCTFVVLLVLKMKNKDWDFYYYRFRFRVMYIERILRGDISRPIEYVFKNEYSNCKHEDKKNIQKLKYWITN